MQASPTKKFQASKYVISFCTAVFIEILGTVAVVDDDIVKRILPFVISGLQPGIRGVSDHKVRFHIHGVLHLFEILKCWYWFATKQSCIDYNIIHAHTYFGCLCV